MRRWFRHPVTALVIIATLGVTVGGVATVFTAFDALLLRELPVREPERLVRIAVGANDLVAWSDFQRIKDAGGPVRVAAFSGGQAIVRDPRTGRAEAAGVERVSASFFEVVGVRMLRGSIPREGERGAVVSSRYASSPAILIDGMTYSVTGVAAFAGTNFASPAHVWVPLEETDRVRVIGRLADGASNEDASRALTTLLAQHDVRVRIGAERAMLIAPEAPGMIRVALIIAAVLAIAVVLVAASNVISVLLAKTMVRRRELAVRAALGATSARIARQLILETLPLALPAALIAQLIALAGSNVITLYMPPGIAPQIDFTPGWRVALFAALMSLLATLFAGAAAAFHARGANAEDLGARGGAANAPSMLRTLVVVQLAFTVVVLLAAALLVQTARAYRAVDPGFESVNQLTVQFSNRPEIERLQTIAGITHGAIATNTPMGRQTPAVIDTAVIDTLEGHVTQIEGDYFGASGIALLRGRNVLPNERNVAVVNEAAKAEIGERVTVNQIEYTVVGVAKNARMSSLGESPRAHAWIAWDHTAKARVLLRANRDLGGVMRDITTTIPDARVTRLDDVVQSDRWLAQTASVLAGALGALTLLLAAVGLFGVVSTIVTSRKRELAVRAALGATPGAIAALVARGSATLLMFGLAIGAALSIPASRALASILFSVDAFDVASWLAVPLLITLVVACATAVPAARAMRTDPADLLQEL